MVFGGKSEMTVFESRQWGNQHPPTSKKVTTKHEKADKH